MSACVANHKCGKSSGKCETPKCCNSKMNRNQNECARDASHALSAQEYPAANGQVIVFMRYKAEMDRRIRNALIRMSGRIKQYGPGHIVGIANKVTVVESPPHSEWLQRDDWCFAVFAFPNERLANLWYVSEPELRQHDFLPPSDGVQLFSMDIRYLPQMGKNTFNWMELSDIKSKSYLQSEYIDKAARLLDSKCVNHGVVFVKDSVVDDKLNRMKDTWIPYKTMTNFALHMYDNEDQFWSIYNSSEYRPLREARHQLCNTTSLLFTVDPRIA
ncbi:uncharacterized protein LOC131947295 isoform X1 [Physella acuta]|uniref:uncharacterized protein LOC131947295 isoform X1 n=2 Tax=Physella acuta TaxID=109671 RepID=UPI0027DDC64F|nr:uncharacterized protein LOC131947295 isoform X1 [Physella acuta]XP_059164450.1 uncharacterized protein LOC131947295 isoform X1 [Physella acuta]